MHNPRPNMITWFLSQYAIILQLSQDTLWTRDPHEKSRANEWQYQCTGFGPICGVPATRKKTQLSLHAILHSPLIHRYDVSLHHNKRSIAILVIENTLSSIPFCSNTSHLCIVYILEIIVRWLKRLLVNIRYSLFFIGVYVWDECRMQNEQMND